MKHKLLLTVILFGGLHILAYRRISTAWKLNWIKRIFLGFVLGMLFISPFLGSWIIQEGMPVTGRMLTLAGYRWIGLFFLFTCLTAALLAINFLLEWWSNRSRKISLQANILFSSVLTLLLYIYGIFEAERVGVTKIPIKSAKMLSTTKPIRIAHISDLHLGLSTTMSGNAAIIALLEAMAPDMIVSTGDFTDRGLEFVRPLAAEWQKLQPPLGKYAVTGNHEVAVGLGKALAFIKKSGFQILLDETRQVGPIYLIGLNDENIRRKKRLDLVAIRAQAKDHFSILLKHRPQEVRSLDGVFDIQLSGHTHGGQIFPFGFFVYLTHGGPGGLSENANGNLKFVSRGVGTWGPPIRIGAPPEIGLIEVGPK